MCQDIVFEVETCSGLVGLVVHRRLGQGYPLFSAYEMSEEIQKGAGEADRRPGATVAAISREIVGTYSEYFGRGPTKAKTLWREGLVICVLEEVFSRPEQMLVDAGRFEQVRSHRLALHDAMEKQMSSAVESATGYGVGACLGQVSGDAIAIEAFVLGRRLPAGPT
jgi:uncharacterized protein YbcI